MLIYRIQAVSKLHVSQFFCSFLLHFPSIVTVYIQALGLERI